MSGDVYVGVVGAGVSAAGTDRLAEQVGRLLGERGAVVVCGGMTGVMEAVCRGAKGAGGTTLGILPGRDRRAANPYVDVAVPTGMGEMRNALIARTADVLIAVGGEFGTLSEIALALKLGKPVVGLGTWELSKQGVASDAIVRAADPAEAVATALSLVSP